jgi:hypothetical protein
MITLSGPNFLGAPNIISGFGWLIQTGSTANYYLNLFDGSTLIVHQSPAFLKPKTWQYLGLVYDYDAGNNLHLFRLSQIKLGLG